ncbi:MAG TPA: hypothetical protein VGA40_07355, partial [Candidatus Acidoferrales bacterium]
PGALPLAFQHLALLSDMADHALRGALNIAARGIPELPADMAHAPFVVLALGRLGTQEMDFGSDADLLFVADESLSPHDREPWRRVAEQLIDIVSSQTRDGILFPVDARLRPRGAEGDLVQPASYLTEYLRQEAQGWEAAAFTKARPVAGNMELGKQIVSRVRLTLMERYRGQDGRAHLAEELAHTRGRMETEGVSAAEPGARGGAADYKSITGGYYDVDYTLAYLRITSGALSGDPSRPGQVIEKIAAFTGAPEEILAVLRDAAVFYRSLDHASRVFSGRPLTVAASPFVTIPRAAELARLLGKWGAAGDAPLESQLVETRRRVREVYERIVLSQARSREPSA